MENFFITISTSSFDEVERDHFVNELEFIKQCCTSRNIKASNETLFMNGGDFIQKSFDLKCTKPQALEFFTLCTLTNYTVTLYKRWDTVLSKDTSLELIVHFAEPKAFNRGLK